MAFNVIPHLGQLAILPAPDAEQIAHHIALLLPVQLRDVLVRPHPGTRRKRRLWNEWMQIYIISPPPHSPGTRLDFHQLKSIAGSAVSSSLKLVLLLSRNKLMQEWKTFSKMLQAYTCTCCAWAPSALPQWWCDGGGSKLRKRCQNIISTKLPPKYVNDTKTISALWDFVRIIYQKQNRLKFIIKTFLSSRTWKATLQISRRAAFCSLDTSCL